MTDQSALFGPYSKQRWQPRRSPGGPEGHPGLELGSGVASMLSQKCSGRNLRPGAPRGKGADASDLHRATWSGSGEKTVKDAVRTDKRR